ncbi:MAG: HAD-IA family hydrolase [Actinomycetia bacterium]|nr:HAD-IA family hydrolase [Actinomycetes bacterium]
MSEQQGRGHASTKRKVAICDLDGTLIDSDSALSDAFVALGIDRKEITFGHVLAEECVRLGLSVEDYVAAYDTTQALPFTGVTELIASFDRWAVCSNKHPLSGRAELERLQWFPEAALFADAFRGPKQLLPLLEMLAITPDQAIFLGDTAHDRQCAMEAGVQFALAGWNTRAKPQPTDVVVSHPLEFLELLGE